MASPILDDVLGAWLGGALVASSATLGVTSLRHTRCSPPRGEVIRVRTALVGGFVLATPSGLVVLVTGD